MTPAARATRNTARLAECHAWMVPRLTAVLHALEQEGFHPRVQCAWRSPADQLAAFQRGTSKLKWGFHNATTPDGKPDALACDILDDDHPLQPPPAYLLRLAWHAEQHGLITGIRWGVPANLVKAIEAAMVDADLHTYYGPGALKLGWDPTHIEPIGLSIADAKAGKRPGTGGTV